MSTSATPQTFGAEDRRALRAAAEELVARLGLAGYDNASVKQADAWVDGAEFRDAFRGGDAGLAYQLGAYLGEAIIRRHGGSWGAGPRGPVVVLKRNGMHMVDPFGKVQKRVVNGIEDHLLALVDLVAHVTTGPRPDDVRGAAEAALREAPAEPPGGLRGLPLLALVFFALIGFPLIVLAVLLCVTDASYALIGGGLAIPLGVVMLVLASRFAGGGARVAFPPGTLAFEAALSTPPLEARLVELIDGMGANPPERTVAEVRFHTAQLRELHDIVRRKDLSRGRGYVGFDAFGTGPSSWAVARGRN